MTPGANMDTRRASLATRVICQAGQRLPRDPSPPNEESEVARLSREVVEAEKETNRLEREDGDSHSEFLGLHTSV